MCDDERKWVAPSHLLRVTHSLRGLFSVSRIFESATCLERRCLDFSCLLGYLDCNRHRAGIPSHWLTFIFIIVLLIVWYLNNL